MATLDFPDAPALLFVHLEHVHRTPAPPFQQPTASAISMTAIAPLDFSNERHGRPFRFRQGQTRPDLRPPPSAVRLLERTLPPPVPVRSRPNPARPPPPPSANAARPPERTPPPPVTILRVQRGPNPHLPLRRIIVPIQLPDLANERHRRPSRSFESNAARPPPPPSANRNTHSASRPPGRTPPPPVTILRLQRGPKPHLPLRRMVIPIQLPDLPNERHRRPSRSFESNSARTPYLPLRRTITPLKLPDLPNEGRRRPSGSFSSTQADSPPPPSANANAAARPPERTPPPPVTILRLQRGSNPYLPLRRILPDLSNERYRCPESQYLFSLPTSRTNATAALPDPSSPTRPDPPPPPSANRNTHSGFSASRLLERTPPPNLIPFGQGQTRRDPPPPPSASLITPSAARPPELTLPPSVPVRSSPNSVRPPTFPFSEPHYPFSCPASRERHDRPFPFRQGQTAPQCHDSKRFLTAQTDRTTATTALTFVHLQNQHRIPVPRSRTF
ncbi:hypothetical protein M407DRAFT_33446 [Tulasnella calospora MUT 4182]|uniref:Uncharacterized protein n=1 Tax=Tulasnella calospora MUT 4182 TaxID=1051891 RepID=A0A0C3Q312_9AGAM|nr:hypothetical protein M407DRAFT_33446 [Tulasnella calospora MUT 4182]